MSSLLSPSSHDLSSAGPSTIQDATPTLDYIFAPHPRSGSSNAVSRHQTAQSSPPSLHAVKLPLPLTQHPHPTHILNQTTQLRTTHPHLHFPLLHSPFKYRVERPSARPPTSRHHLSHRTCTYRQVAHPGSRAGSMIGIRGSQELERELSEDELGNGEKELVEVKQGNGQADEWWRVWEG
jgi:hypothetical protein